jgi:glucose-1-phosphate thymidylyltransferase
MKVIIPMAGMGSRLRPHTLTIPKPLTLIAGKSIVQRLVEEIALVVGETISDIGFIIGPLTKGFPENTASDLEQIAKNLGATPHIFVQEQPLGTAHAIHQARTLLQGSVVVAFADTLFKADFKMNPSYDGVIWVKKVNNPEQFGVVKMKDGIITDFVEKPKKFVSDLAIIGIYYFKHGEALQNEIDYIIDNDVKGKGGEYQLTDALEFMKEKGMKFIPGTVDDWMDSGNYKVTIETNQKVLMYAHQNGENLVSDKVELNNSTIIEPCYIGDHVVLTNSTVGPYVSLGNDSKVVNSKIENSLIQKESLIQNATLKDSMLGSNVSYNGKFQRISLGDFSKTE